MTIGHEDNPDLNKQCLLLWQMFLTEIQNFLEFAGIEVAASSAVTFDTQAATILSDSAAKALDLSSSASIDFPRSQGNILQSTAWSAPICIKRRTPKKLPKDKWLAVLLHFIHCPFPNQIQFGLEK